MLASRVATPTQCLCFDLLCFVSFRFVSNVFNLNICSIFGLANGKNLLLQSEGKNSETWTSFCTFFVFPIDDQRMWKSIQSLWSVKFFVCAHWKCAVIATSVLWFFIILQWKTRERYEHLKAPPSKCQLQKYVQYLPLCFDIYIFIIDVAPPCKLHTETERMFNDWVYAGFFYNQTLYVTLIHHLFEQSKKKSQKKKSLIVVFPFTVIWPFDLSLPSSVCMFFVSIKLTVMILFDVTFLIPLNFSCTHFHSIGAFDMLRET